MRRALVVRTALVLAMVAAVACATAQPKETPQKRRTRTAQVQKRKLAQPLPPAEDTAATAPSEQVAAPEPAPAEPPEEGLASYYADSLAGNRTANGERYRPDENTCAHRTHKFGTKLVVTSVETGKSAVCRVNDRGPFVAGRVVDVSKRVAGELGMLKRGVIKVRVERAAEGAGS